MKSARLFSMFSKFTEQLCLEIPLKIFWMKVMFCTACPFDVWNKRKHWSRDALEKYFHNSTKKKLRKKCLFLRILRIFLKIMIFQNIPGWLLLDHWCSYKLTVDQESKNMLKFNLFIDKRSYHIENSLQNQYSDNIQISALVSIWWNH